MSSAIDFEASYPLTASQREIWLDQITQSDVPLYNVGGYMPMRGPLDAGLLSHAVELLLEKHDTLRILLSPNAKEDGLPRQTIAPWLPARALFGRVRADLFKT